MATEPITNQLKDKLIARFQSIDPAVDSEFWYKPDKVVAPRLMTAQTVASASNYQEVILIAMGDGIESEKTTGPIRQDLDIFILAARQWKVDVEDAFTTQEDQRLTIQNRLIRDVTRAIFYGPNGTKDNSFDNLIYNLEVKEERRDIDIPDGWAVVILRCVCEYDYLPSAP